MARLGQHSRTSDWFDGPLLIEISEDYGSKDALDKAEYQAIVSEYPRYNIVYNPLGAPRGRVRTPPKKHKQQRNDFPVGMWELGQISHWVRTASTSRIKRRLGNGLKYVTNTEAFRSYPFDDFLTKPLDLAKPLTKDQKSLWEKPIPGRSRTFGQSIFKPNKYENPEKWALVARALFRHIRKKRGIKGPVCNTHHARKFFADTKVLKYNPKSVKTPLYRRRLP